MAPDEAALIGRSQLAPAWMLAGHDAILAMDIGGTHMRVEIVAVNSKKDLTLKKAAWIDEPARGELTVESSVQITIIE